jgi:hypothetical protein
MAINNTGSNTKENEQENGHTQVIKENTPAHKN